jgi:asparagine synthase (glutamine-hydrolysing)
VFLDNDLVAFCRRLPSRFKYRGRRRKILLRKALAPLLPSAVIDRRKKGFGIPLAGWLKHIVPDTHHSIDGLRRATIAKAWDEHRSGAADHRLMLWTWLSLQHVTRAYAARPGHAGAA